MEAIILAGGFGTRLQSVVSDVPKPMAPINGKPFLEYILLYLKKYGINKVVLAVSYKKDIIKDYFKDYFYGINIIYSEENEPLGTGGAIKEALKNIDSHNVYVLNGDTYFDIDLRKMKLNKNKIQISLKLMHNFDRYGSVIIDNDGSILEFCEKEYKKVGLINGGIYLIRRDLFNDFNAKEVFLFEDFIKNNVRKLNVSSVVFDDYFIDIGIPSDYKQACCDFIKLF